MVKINNRKVGLCILLSIVSLSIYQIFWMYLLVKNTRALKRNDSSCLGEMLCLLFVPFYPLYWWYTRGKLVKEKLAGHKCHARGSGKLYLVLGIFGLHIVSMAIMQKDFNKATYSSADKITLDQDQRFFIRRVLEVILAELVISVIAIIPYFFDIYNNRETIFWASLTAAFLYF